MPKISFLIPVKNREPYIGEAIRSIQSQKLRDLEIFIINDHSIDGTKKVIEEFQRRDPRISLIENQGHGQVQALNQGFPETSGDYIKCIDSDDFLSPSFSDKLDLLTSCDATYHDAEIVDSQLRKINHLHTYI